MAGADTGILELPYEATGALVKFRFVKLSGDQTVQQASVAGEYCLGVCKVDISSTEATNGKGTAVQILGVAFVEASATIARGAEVATTNDGRAVTAATGNAVLGRALKGGVVGDWILVLLTPGARLVP